MQIHWNLLFLPFHFVGTTYFDVYIQRTVDCIKFKFSKLSCKQYQITPRMIRHKPILTQTQQGHKIQASSFVSTSDATIKNSDAARILTRGRICLAKILATSCYCNTSSVPISISIALRSISISLSNLSCSILVNLVPF